MGGEESPNRNYQACQVGLPPRGRGRDTSARNGTASRGITPAWAGKRPFSGRAVARKWDYPRVGGEELVASSLPTSEVGLPPRGRGRERFAEYRYAQSRITPAWAGKSLCLATGRLININYPRVGGEESAASRSSASAAGLPPRGRGRGLAGRPQGVPSRITPAWAGKSSATARPSSARPDYPRVGGEEACTCKDGPTASGLPPRGRGRVLLPIIHLTSVRITPAWAGKRSATTGTRSSRRDYPRVGGEEGA